MSRVCLLSLDQGRALFEDQTKPPSIRSDTVITCQDFPCVSPARPSCLLSGIGGSLGFLPQSLPSYYLLRNILIDDTMSPPDTPRPVSVLEQRPSTFSGTSKNVFY